MECLSSSAPHHRLTCSGFDMASHTRWRGASKSRVSVISQSDGVVTLKLWLFAAVPTAMFLLLFFQFLQVVAQPVEPGFPDVSIAVGPIGHFFQRAGLDSTWAPLCFASARNQSCALEHAQVLRYRGHAHVERLGELGDRAFARC